MFNYALKCIIHTEVWESSAARTSATHKDSMCLIFWMSWLSLLVCFFSFSTSSLDDLCFLRSRLSSSRRDRFLSDMAASQSFVLLPPVSQNQIIPPPVSHRDVLKCGFSQRSQRASGCLAAKHPSGAAALPVGPLCFVKVQRRSTVKCGITTHVCQFFFALDTGQFLCVSKTVRNVFF